MEDTTNVTYDDVVQTKNVQILKSIVPFLDVRSQRPAAMLIQYMEMQNAYRTFSRPDNSLAACSLGDGIDRRSAILGIFARVGGSTLPCRPTGIAHACGIRISTSSSFFIPS